MKAFYRGTLHLFFVAAVNRETRAGDLFNGKRMSYNPFCSMPEIKYPRWAVEFNVTSRQSP